MDLIPCYGAFSLSPVSATVNIATGNIFVVKPASALQLLWDDFLEEVLFQRLSKTDQLASAVITSRL